MEAREYMRTGNGPKGLSSIDTTEAREDPPLHVEDVPGWEKLPRSVSEALTGDNLDFNSHGVLTFLIGAVNWKTGVYRGTIRRLAEDVVGSARRTISARHS
jgi:hypothetical protein